jgi:tRNA dimethylallyltransferase
VNEAYAALTHEDPARAAALAPADGARIARALEVVRSTGRTLADWQTETVGGIGDQIALRPLILTPDRAWLYERCDRRFSAMWRGGALPEVAALLARKLDPALPVMRAIGVAEIADFLGGEITEAEAITSGQQATRRYAKRQYTWLRHQPPAAWPRLTLDNSSIAPALEALLRD